MSEEHKSIKVSHYGSSYDGKVYIMTGFSGEDITLRFPGIPTELQYKVPPKLVIDSYNRVQTEFGDELKQIFDAHGGKAYEKASSLTHKVRYDIHAAPEVLALDEKLKEEATEIIEHFESMMRAMLVDYAAERYKTLNSAVDRLSVEVHQHLANVLKHGESALPKDE